MINEADRQSLINYRLEQAKETIDLSRFLIDSGKFVASQRLDKKYGKILRNSYQNRTKGDYDAFVQFEKEEGELMQIEMTDFIKEIEKLILD